VPTNTAKQLLSWRRISYRKIFSFGAMVEMNAPGFIFALLLGSVATPTKTSLE
jgi:hypothetical protein